MWSWDKHKLGCKIRVETHNPALDELRETTAADGCRRENNIRTRASSIEVSNSPAVLVSNQHDSQRTMSNTRKNIYKKFFEIPRSPPAKIILDMQKERLRLNLSTSAYAPPHSLMKTRSEEKSILSPKLYQRQQEWEAQSDVNSGDLLMMTQDDHSGKVIHQSPLNKHASRDAHHTEHKLPKQAKPILNQMNLSYKSSTPKCDAQEDFAGVENASQPKDEPDAQKAKLDCVNSIAAWSAHGENVARLAEEGAVPGILMLSQDENESVRGACATAFGHMSRHAELCEQLMKHNAVPVISNLGINTIDATISRDCTLALVNLTTVDGVEAKLVEDGVVVSFLTLMNQHEIHSEACSYGLFNLTCVDQPYMHIERVIKAFVSLATSTDATVKHICAAALCNLSDIKPIRSRIVEEGVVQVVGLLARGAEARTRRVCAIVLHSLASTRACRADMVTKGAVQILYALSSDADTITLHYIASATTRLATDAQNLPRLVHEGGVTALCNICLRCPQDIPTTKLCASALCLLSQQAIGRQAIVQEGCVPALVSLLHESSDLSTIQQGLYALTTLLADENNHEQVLGQGGIAAVIELCGHASPVIREACSLALFNFSCGKAPHERGISASAIPAIIALSRLPEPRTRLRCAATLCKLAAFEANVSLMVDEGVVSAFIDMLQTGDQDIVKHCCVALCRLAHEGSSAVTITEGAVPKVIAGCGGESDPTTRISCCAVLSAVSAHEPCRRPLCAMGTLEPLISLARDRGADDTTRLRCAVAFANLSHEPAVQGEMVTAGVVPVVAELSNSYCEENQLYCARALCNLGCHSGSEQAIVEQGGVTALMMICMVRAVSHFTKQICAKAILNLVCAPLVIKDWLPQLADEGLVQAVSVLSRLPEEQTMGVCASIFCTISAHGLVGRQLLVKRRSTLKDIFSLMRSSDKATQTFCGKAVFNLLGHADSQNYAVQAGAIPVLSTLCTLGEPEVETAAADICLLLSGEAAYRQEITEANVVPALIESAKSQNPATCQSSLRVLAHLAWWSHMRTCIIHAEVMPTLASLIEQTPSIVPGDLLTEKLILHIITYISCVSEEYKVMLVQNNILPLLDILFCRLSSSGDIACALHARKFIAMSVRSLTASQGAINKLVGDGAIRLVCNIMCAGEDTNSDVYENCAISLYSVAQTQYYNDVLLEQGLLKAISRLAQHPECFGIAASILYLLSSDPQHRELVVLDSGARNLLFAIADQPTHSKSAIQFCAQTLFCLSRCAAESREVLISAGIVPLLLRLSGHDDEKVASPCSEALRNLSSEGSSAIEEGTVSRLLAEALSYPRERKSAAIIDVSPAKVSARPLVLDNYGPSSDILCHLLIQNFKPFTISIIKMIGGVAGSGPAPPEPPEMDVHDPANHVPFDGTDNTDDDENIGASMMFAKMNTESLSISNHQQLMLQ